MKALKLNALLAATDSLGSAYKAMVKDYGKFFAGKQGAFKGLRSTYDVKDGMVDDPSKRKNDRVQTTVVEKLDWFKENAKDYIDALFSQEKTNSSGVAKAMLVVEGEEWGEFTSLELLRLKSIVESNDIYNMLQNIPVRSDAKEWTPATAEMYTNREIVAGPLLTGVAKTTTKESFILPDPNLKGKDLTGYVPQVSQKTETVDVADYSVQEFSGEITQRERASMLKRRTVLLTAVIVALKQCNDVEASPSELNSDKIFGYLFG